MDPFNYIQSFIIKSNSVNNSPTVLATSVDLYFKGKPTETDNSSGIYRPGARIHLCKFVGDVPNPDDDLLDSSVRADWSTISTVADATVPTKFTFETPVLLRTDVYYGLVVVFDDNDFELFQAVQNQTVLNTTKKYSGSAGEGDGKLYVHSDDDTIKPLSDRDLKFEMRIAKYTANTVTVDVCNDDYEFFTCTNMSTSSKFKGGEFVFQNQGLVANSTVNTFFSQAGTLATVTGNSFAVGTSTLFTSAYSEGDYVLLTNTSNTAQQDVAKISSIIDDTNIEFEDQISFSNTCWHNKVVVGEVARRSYISKYLYLTDSTASNSTIRFHTNSVQYFTISNPGGSYSNNDTIAVTNGAATATGVLVTNATGNVVAIRMTSAGGTFPNASHSVTTITTSTGSGASIVPVIKTKLKGVISGATADLSSIDNLEADIVDPEISIDSTSSSYSNVEYSIANSGGYIQAFDKANLVDPIDIPYPATIMSRSNELKSSSYLYNTDKSSIFKIALGVKTAGIADVPTFAAPHFLEHDLNAFVFMNKIDATTANTESEIGRGSLKSKHITKKIVLANNNLAEDIRVYINAYKPSNTNILMYAKIYNASDSETYDDKSWSPLELKSGQNLVSATGNKEDVKEFEYGFPAYPESRFTCDATATTTLSSTIATTSKDLSSNLASGDLIKIYNPLFSTTNYLVTSVDSVNSTAVVLHDAISNNGLVGSSLKIDKLKFKNVAYNNVLNDNVVRYFTTTMSPVDGYDTMTVKMVFLADTSTIVPEVDDIRVIAVSA